MGVYTYGKKLKTKGEYLLRYKKFKNAYYGSNIGKAQKKKKTLPRIILSTCNKKDLPI